VQDRLDMRNLVLTIIFFTFYFTAFAQLNDSDRILGEWLNEEKSEKIEIYKNGNSYFGKLIGGKDLFDTDGNSSKKDARNPDPKLRSRTLYNLDILNNFAYNDGLWNGKLYDPKSGKTYNCTIKIKNNKLEVRGYVGISLLGHSTYWLRAQ
jgi:uncharacterized protein (DUF2147 family)